MSRPGKGIADGSGLLAGLRRYRRGVREVDQFPGGVIGFFAWALTSLLGVVMVDCC